MIRQRSLCAEVADLLATRHSWHGKGNPRGTSCMCVTAPCPLTALTHLLRDDVLAVQQYTHHRGVSAAQPAVGRVPG